MQILFLVLSVCLFVRLCVYHPLPSIRQHLSYDDCLEGRLSELFCAVLYNTIVHNYMHTDMSQAYNLTYKRGL